MGSFSLRVFLLLLLHAAKTFIAACQPQDLSSPILQSIFLPVCPVINLQKQIIMASASVEVEASTAAPTLKILCFGDSLTAGYTSWGMQHFPYAVHLRDKLSAALPTTKIHVDIEGMSGAQVRGQYTGRLNRACEKARDEPYDWIIIMGGTNDLGWGGQPQEIYDALSRWTSNCVP